MTGAPVPPGYLPEDPCTDARAAALIRIARGQAYADLAGRLSSGDAPADDDAAATTTTGAPASAPATVQLDCPELSPDETLTASEARQRAEDCDRAHRPAGGESEGALAALKKSWDDAEKNVVAPLRALALPVAAVALALLVAARLVIPLIRTWPKLAEGWSPWLGVISTTTVVTAAVTLVAGLTDTLPGPWSTGLIVGAVVVLLAAAFSFAMVMDPPGAVAAVVVAVVFGLVMLGPALGLAEGTGLLALGILLSALAVALVALEMATRLRLSISVRDPDKDSETNVGHLVALLEEMGGEGPRGLEVPRGSDATALTSTVIAKDPTGAVVKALWAAWQLLVSPIPWRVQVDEDGDGRLNIVITRNGRSESAVVVDPADLLQDLGPEGGAARTPDPYRFAASAILVTLERRHGSFSGLYGVTDWRSLGYHCVATLDIEDEEVRRRALAKALRAQGDNLPAQLALQTSLYRRATEPAPLLRYATWLESFITRLKERQQGVTPLMLRAHNLRVTALINHYYATHQQGRIEDKAVLGAMTNLEEAVSSAERRAGPRARPEAFLGSLRRRVDWLKAAYQQDGEPPSTDSTPRAAYSAACHHAAVTANHAEAVRLLGLADVDPDLRSWRSEDPQLRFLQSQEVYKLAYPRKPRTDPMELPPLASVARELRWAGLDTVDVLAEYAGRERDLARFVGGSPEVTRRVAAAAGMVVSLTRVLPDHAVEVVHEFAGRNLLDHARLLALTPDERTALAESVRTSLAGRVDLPDAFADNLRTWLAVP